MRTLIAFLMLFTVAVNAQTVNNAGYYVSANGDLYNGLLTTDQDGIRITYTVKAGVLEGEASYYYASGKLMEKGSFAKGKKNDQWLRYTENGILSAVAFYKAGKKDGSWLVFDDMGRKRFEMFYTDGEKSGIWTQWDEQGNVVDKKDYLNVN